MKLYVNGHGWVCGIIRGNGNGVAGLRFCKSKIGAKPFAGDWTTDREAYDALDYIEDVMQCHVDKVND
jgi:hypothetical protein